MLVFLSPDGAVVGPCRCSNTEGEPRGPRGRRTRPGLHDLAGTAGDEVTPRPAAQEDPFVNPILPRANGDPSGTCRALGTPLAFLVCPRRFFPLPVTWFRRD